jgi:anion-transporting  ArsA/GET3 family ATPase
VEFVRGEEYAKFTRIVFDTAPTGHTLRLLAVPDFVEAALGKIVRLRKKLGAAGDAVRGLFGASDQQDSAVEKLEKLRVRPLACPRSPCWIPRLGFCMLALTAGEGGRRAKKHREVLACCSAWDSQAIQEGPVLTISLCRSWTILPVNPRVA